MNDTSRMIELLESIERWTRVSSQPTVKKVLEQALDDPRDLKIYQMLDGSKTYDQIRKDVGTSPNRISDVVKRCEKLGLINTHSSGKKVRAFDLTDFGLYEPDSVEDKTNE